MGVSESNRQDHEPPAPHPSATIKRRQHERLRSKNNRLNNWIFYMYLAAPCGRQLKSQNPPHPTTLSNLELLAHGPIVVFLLAYFSDTTRTRTPFLPTDKYDE